MEIVSEQQTGLSSKFTIHCKLCKVKFSASTTDPNQDATLDLDRSAVAGMMTTGIGLSQFQELTAAMDLPGLNDKRFKRVHDELHGQWTKVALEAMEKAAERERTAAIAEGRVTADGIALIDVIVDGCWSKRSYKCFNAASGVAAIIGRRFGEVLFIGVRNKYCCICARAQQNNQLAKEHRCFKNFTGPSTAMEADILLEGFKCSIDMHNLIYCRMIADGDASTYAKISSARPYPNVSIEKIECRNHIFRNMCNKLNQIAKDTKFPISLRKYVTVSRVLALRKAICLSIKEHVKEPNNLIQNTLQLHTDIINSPHHAFGDHGNCKAYYCQSARQSENVARTLKMSSLWYRIQQIINTVASHSRSLIQDADSNIVECYNSIVAKFVGGKRINFSLRHGYQSRCNAAVVSFNTKKPLHTLQKSILGYSPRSKVKKLEEARQKRNASVKRQKYKKNRISCNRSTDNHYGENCAKPDLDSEELSRQKHAFLLNLKKSDDEIMAIERRTVLQRDCSEWLELRRHLITASNFGLIIKRQKNFSAVVKSLLYKSNLSHIPSIKHGIEHEPIAIQQLEIQENVKIEPCGLFIDRNDPFLGATPDGTIGSDTIVEIKCPISSFRLGLEQAIKSRKILFWKNTPHGTLINKRSNWYFQIQGQLHITNRKKCLFGVWSGENCPVDVEYIERDDAFWEKEMYPKLHSFYHQHSIPELLDPRHSRGMPIREDTVAGITALVPDLSVITTAVTSASTPLSTLIQCERGKKRKLDFEDL